MDDHLVITLRVFDRKYQLRIKRNKEVLYRKAADTIEKKTAQYRNSFAGENGEALRETDYMVMTTIQALSENEDLELQNKAYEDKIKTLSEDIESFLKKFS